MPELIIDDSNFAQFVDNPIVDGEKKGRGLIPRNFGEVPHGSFAHAGPFNLPIIPRSDWSGLIKEAEAAKSRLSDIVRAAGMKSLNQGMTNYCWANGPVNCVRVIRAANNQPFVDLSPASVAVPVVGENNVGGFGHMALKQIVSDGVAATSFWPANAIDESFKTAETMANAAKHKVTEWWDLLPRNFDQVATCLLLGIPVAVGYDWWRHEVTALDLVEISANTFGIRIWNSWGDSWPNPGDGGMAVLGPSHAIPDDAVAPRVVTVSQD